MSLLQKFFLLNKLEHLVAQFLSPLGIEVQNIAAQAGIWFHGRYTWYSFILWYCYYQPCMATYWLESC